MGELRERDSVEHCRFGGGVVNRALERRKISALESLFDERVKCLALVDPVDNTQYAPLGPGFPSAVMGMESDDREKKKFGPPATLVIGGLKGEECAPLGSNYANFLKQRK